MIVITATGTGQTSENAVCVKSAKDERYGPISATFRDHTIAEGSRDGSKPLIFS